MICGRGSLQRILLCLLLLFLLPPVWVPILNSNSCMTMTGLRKWRKRKKRSRASRRGMRFNDKSHCAFVVETGLR